MKRTSMILACGIVAGLAASSMAQSTVWMDIRDNVSANQLITSGTAVFPFTEGQGAEGAPNLNFGAGAINSGRRGAGEILRISPTFVAQPGQHTGTSYPNMDADGTYRTGNAWIYMDVADDASGTGDVISSLGLDTILTSATGTMANTIASAAVTIFNDATVAASAGGSPATPWNGVVNGASNLANPPSVLGSKAVRVPVTTGPAYAASLGIQPSVVGPYRVGQLRVTAGNRNCTFSTSNAANSSYNVKLTVNNLLCTRVFQSGGDAQEDLNIGYDPYGTSGGFGTLDVSINGSTNGASSSSADMVIQVRVKGDFTGDGRVLVNDLAGFNSARAVGGGTFPTAKQFQTYCGDFAANDRKVLVNDLAGFNSARANAATAPCP